MAKSKKKRSNRTDAQVTKMLQSTNKNIEINIFQKRKKEIWKIDGENNR